MATTIEPTTDELRACRKCQRELPRSEFFVYRKSGTLSHICSKCNLLRKNSGIDPTRSLGWAIVDASPDASPPRALRAELCRLREAGVSWAQAWPLAVDAVLAELDDPKAWLEAFSWAELDWRAGYLRESFRCHAPSL